MYSMYGQSSMDLNVTPPRVAWQMLRTLRSAPPGSATKGRRRAVFAAAMEQAEQLFGAAQEVGSATRPLLAFYGLSQAGRAIAAASHVAAWELKGHGVTVRDLESARTAPLSGLVVADHGRGSFTQLAEILQAGSLPEATTLGELWPALPELWRFPLPGATGTEPLILRLEGGSRIRSASQIRLRVSNFPDAVGASFAPGAEISYGQEETWNEERRRLSDHMRHFPSLVGWKFTTPKGNPVGFRRISPNALETSLMWDAEGQFASDVAFLERVSFETRGECFAYPALSAAAVPAHPLLIWWALLFALSMLARYEPQAWAEVISVDKSSAAAPVEYMLEEALKSLPEIIHRTVLAVAA